MQQIADLAPIELEILPNKNAQLIARFFQVLADPTRVRLVKALADGKWCVSDLVQALEMDQPAISHQLKYLRKHRLVNWEKNGRHVYYTLSHPLLRHTILTAVDELIED
jgi:ArsR family transcriptional regulator, lead/cadmium/zinc/bismuth-responsive transcriptional repressor